MEMSSGGEEGPFLDSHSAKSKEELHSTCGTPEAHFDSCVEQRRVEVSDRILVDFASHTVEQDRLGACYKAVTARTTPPRVSPLLRAAE